MMSILKRIISKLRETRWQYKRFNSDVRIKCGGLAEINSSAIIKRTTIYVDSSSKLIIKGNVRLEGVGLFLTNGASVEIGEFSFLEMNRNSVSPEYIVNGGTLVVGSHTKLACQRLWIRFGGKCKIGDYTNVNDGTEIRTDENVYIGSFCLIIIEYGIQIHTIFIPKILGEK